VTPISFRPIFRALVLSAALLGLAVAPVFADAALVEATPEADEVVTDLPDTLRLVFNEPLDAGRSSVELRDEAGETVAEGELSPDEATTLEADLPDLEPGTYEVRYTAGSADGHLVRDTYTFTVEVVPTPSPTLSPTPSSSPAESGAPSPTASAEASSPSSAPTREPSASARPDPGTTAGGSADVLIPIVAGLAVLALLGAVFLRRRRA
jgi:LPXTG-motif cell wall-anchored protein